VKRLILCGLAIALTSITLYSKPVYACVANPDCDPWDCQDFCAATGHTTGTCNWCTGQCRCS